MSRLPQAVQQQGLYGHQIERRTCWMVVSIYDESDRSETRRRRLGLPGLGYLQEADRAGCTGVGDVSVFGAQYAMRIWLDPLQGWPASS